MGAHHMKIETRHDFGMKLAQPSIFPVVREYVRWQKAVRAAEVAGLPVPPMPHIPLISINLDLTTACNYACDHCIDFEMLNSGSKYKHVYLLETLDSMIERGLRSVILIGGGEPTLYPAFDQTVRFLKDRGVHVAIVSNGSRNEKIYKIADTLTDERDWVRLSLDSGTNATFQKMHKPKRPISLEEICSGVSRIRERNSRLQIGFSFIIVWDGAEQGGSVGIIENLDEIVSAAKLARDHGFSYISYKPYLTRHPSGAEVMDASVMESFNQTIEKIRDGIEGAKALETDNFRVSESTNLRVLVEGTWRNYTNQPQRCHMTAFRQVFTADGVYHCPTHRGIAKARIGNRARGEMPAHPDVTRMINTFDAAHECVEITCLYNSANWWIENMINDEREPISEISDRGDYYL
jgi:molybdenum cofactor biosynthesis enzyme MoaA